MAWGTPRALPKRHLLLVWAERLGAVALAGAIAHPLLSPRRLDPSLDGFPDFRIVLWLLLGCQGLVFALISVWDRRYPLRDRLRAVGICALSPVAIATYLCAWCLTQPLRQPGM